MDHQYLVYSIILLLALAQIVIICKCRTKRHRDKRVAGYFIFERINLIIIICLYLLMDILFTRYQLIGSAGLFKIGYVSIGILVLYIFISLLIIIGRFLYKCTKCCKMNRKRRYKMNTEK